MIPIFVLVGIKEVRANNTYKEKGKKKIPFDTGPIFSLFFKKTVRKLRK